jgi:hypothetical protein
MRITSSGNVGIGTAGRSASGYTILGVDNATNGGVIEVLQNGTIKGQLFYDGTQTRLRSNLSTDLVLDTNDTERMRIDSSGNVGIGTSSLSNGVKAVIQGSQTGGAAATSGTTQTYGLLRLQGTTFTSALDMGTNGGNYAWIQSTDQTNLGTNYSLVINPNGGNVGIGTTSPSAALDVNGEVLALSGAGTADRHIEIGVGRTGNGNSYVDLIGDTTYSDYGARLIRYNTGANAPTRLDHRGTGELSMWASDAGALQFGTGNTERMRIDSSGRVGIGTSSPSGVLNVVGNGSTHAIRVDGLGTSQVQDFYAVRNGSTTIQSGPNLTFQNPSGGTTYATTIQMGPTGEQLFFNYNGSAWNERMRIDGSGNVTLGAGGTYRLDINAPTSSAAKITCDNTSMEIGTFDNHVVKFLQHNTERMRIDSNGNLLIGTTSNRPDENNDPGMALYPNGKKYAYSTTDFGVFNTNSTGKKFYFRINSSEKGSISFNTNSVSYTTTSDYRLKENAVDITDGITRVKQLDPKRFNFIGDSTIVDGFIAHEAATVVPEAVTGEKDAVDEDGNPDYQGIDQAKLVPLLTAALQEAITKIEDLEARVVTLEGN